MARSPVRYIYRKPLQAIALTPASQVAIAGDSAGGNIALGLLGHILHPRADVPKVELSEPLAAAVLISPWISFKTDDDSWKRNATADMLPPEAVYRWRSLFLGDKQADEYSEPIRADANFYSGLPQVSSILTARYKADLCVGCPRHFCLGRWS